MTSVQTSGPLSPNRTRRLLGALAVSGLILVAQLALAAPADAGYRAFRLGVHAFGLTEPQLNSMRNARVQTLRLAFSWGRTETTRPEGRNCSTAVYDWTYYDKVVTWAHQRGIRLLPMIAGSPRYVSSTGKNPPHTSSAAMDSYLCFVRALVQQYGRGGMMARLGVTPITQWQVWNEPNLHVWSARGKADPREYARFLKQTRRQILRVDPRASIVLAGMPEAVGAGLSIHDFLRKFYRVRGIKRKFDVLAMHPYARDHRGVKGALIRLRRTLRRLHDARRPLWLTETGWASAGPRHHFLVSSEKGQARRLTKTFRMLRANRRRFKLGTIIWFSYRDQATVQEKSSEWQFYTGLWRKDGSVKPACRRFARFTKGGTCRPIATESTTTSGALLEAAGADGIVPSAPE